MLTKSFNRYLKKHPKTQLQHIIFLPNLFVRYFIHLFHFHQLKSIYSEYGFRRWNIKKFKSSNTLFILGSGASINKINNDQWNVISEHDSIGFNFWFIHDFVPTYYVAEIKGDERRLSAFFTNLIRKAGDYCNTPFIFKYSSLLLNNLHKVPNKLKRLYFASEITIPGEVDKDFYRWILILNCLGFFSERNNKGYIVYKRASLCWLLIFALNLGYQEIVLCGVDLNSTNYFFENNQRFYEDKGLIIPDSGQTGKVHLTNDPSKRGDGPTIQKVISIINKQVLIPQKINLYVASKRSTLYPEIPLFNW